MLFDTITLLDGSKLENVVVESGSSFPNSPDAGQLFFKTTDTKLYVYDGTAWAAVGSGTGQFTVTGDVTGSLDAGAGTLTLETVNSNVGSYGSAGSVASVTVNAKGLVTAASETAISITPSQISTTIPLAKGGTGQTTASAAINALVPAQTNNAGKFLMSNGTSVSWQVPAAGTVTSVGLSGGVTGLTVTGGPITTSGDLTLGGVLGVSSGGTGQTTASAALNALLPNQTPHAGKLLTTNGGTTSWTAVTSGMVTGGLGYTPVNKGGDTMTGILTLSADPTSDLEAATKRYVDNVAAGINVLGAVRTATTSELSVTYLNGTSGVGATLTGSTTLPSIGGVTLSLGQRVLVKNQTTALQNGIYVVTSTANPYILTRASDYDGRVPGAIDAGDTVFVQEGDLAGTLWVQNTAGTLTVGSSSLTWTQFSGPGSYSAGTGIGLANNVISNSGVLSISAGQNLAVSASTGAVTVSFDGTLPVANGGTGQTSLPALMAALAGGATLNRFLGGNGSSVELRQISLNTDAVIGTLPIARGGTGQTTAAAAADALLPAQINNAGKFLMTTGSALQWVGISVEGSGGSLQFNNAGQFDGTAQISYNATDTLTVGANAGTFTLTGAAGATGLTVRGGTTIGGGPVSDINRPTKSSTLTLSGGRADARPSSGQGDPGSPSIAGGDVVIEGGTSANYVGGSILFKTAATNTLTTRLEITNSGEWLIGGSAGVANQILVSNGEGAAPSWATPTFNGTVTSVGVSGGSTGLTTSGGPVTGSGTITLAGTLAIANGGTGQTTASGAINALLPAQGGNSGKFLMTDGTSATWVPAAGAGTVTSVAASGGATGLSFTGGPIIAAGTLTLGGTLAVSAGGTGATSESAALVNLAGGATTNRFLGGDGTNIALRQIDLSTDAVTSTLPVARGGTGQTSASAAINALVPTQAGNVGKYLTTNGSTISWAPISSPVAAGNQGEIQYNDSGVTSASPALTLVSDVLTLTEDVSIKGLTAGKGSGTGPIVSDGQGGTTLSDSQNTAFGQGVLSSASFSTNNSGFGFNALSSLTTATNNTAVGHTTLASNTVGVNNTAVGFSALNTNIDGNYNVAVGANSLKMSVGSSNTAIGSSALRLTFLGNSNTSVGDSSLYNNDSGSGNTAVGSFALTNNTTASNSTAIGKSALYSSYGAGNTAVGESALYGNTAGANNVAIGKGAGSALTNGDDNVIIGRHAGEAGLAGTIILSAGTSQRLRFNFEGALEFTEGAGYGSSGQILTSNGSGTAPTWQSFSALPNQTGNSGRFLTTNGTTASWGTVASPDSIANTVTLGTDATSAVNLTVIASSGGAPSALTIRGAGGGTGANSTGGTITIVGGTALNAADTHTTGGPVYIKGGLGNQNAGGSAGGGNVFIEGGDGSYRGGNVSIRGGDSATGSGIYQAGNVTISSGQHTGAGSTGSSISLSRAGSDSTGGSITISSGAGSAGGGALVFQTAATSSLTERFRILNNGSWSVGTTGSAVGTSGQVLTSNGAGSAPTWQSVPAEIPSQTGNSGKYLSTDGSAVSWVTVNSASILPAQTDNSGKYLTTDGTNVSWSTVAGGASLPSQTGNSGKFLTTDGTTASWGNPLGAVASFGASYSEVDSTITASATTTIDCALSNNFSVSLAASIATLSFSNVPASGRLFVLTLFLAQDATGGKTVGWPASFRWAGGSAPTLTSTANKVDIITAVTRDGGSTWFAMVAGQNF